MAREHTKCTVCSDKLWFDNDSVAPQAVQCSCRTTTLTESGVTGSYEDLTNDEVGEITFGIRKDDLMEMRTIFDNASINRPRHCFRWSTIGQRWELSEVAPADRTLKATKSAMTWTTV